MTIVGDAKGAKMNHSPARSLQGRLKCAQYVYGSSQKEPYLSHRKSKYLIKSFKF